MLCKVSFLVKLSMNFTLSLSIETSYYIKIIAFIDSLRAVAIDCHIRLQYRAFSMYSEFSYLDKFNMFLSLSLSIQSIYCYHNILFIDSLPTAIDCQRMFIVLQRIVTCYQITSHNQSPLLQLNLRFKF